MNTSLPRLACALLVQCVSSGLASRSLAQTQDFTLINDTGVSIYGLYVSATGQDTWGPDILGQNTLPNGMRVDVAFRGETACLWDLMAKDGTGGEIYWREIDLCRYAVVALHCGPKGCWATFR